jgi:glutathione S-transferase
MIGKTERRMKLYDGGRAPNPRRVRIFIGEKGITVPTEQVDLPTMAHRSEFFTAINPLQEVPALVLDDGTIITESIAICRYFEALHPTPAMFGGDALDQARVEMWNRRIEHNLFFAVTQVFRHLHPGMKAAQVPQVAAWGEANQTRVATFLPILDRQLADCRFVAGDNHSVADITALVTIDFMKAARLALAPEYRNILRWHTEVAARPSAKA